MPIFEVKCQYIGIRKERFFRDQESVDYYKFLVENPEKLPRQCFHSSTRLGKGDFNPNKIVVDCAVFIPDNLIKKAKLDFKYKYKQYHRFIMNLQEPKTADFTIYYNVPPALGGQYEIHKMVLKTKQYFENTVKKIGFWGSENYFYEVDKKEKSPSKPKQSNSNQTPNNIWVKIVLICLPFLILGLFFILLFRWISRRKK